MEKPPEKGGEEVARNHGVNQQTTNFLRKKGQEEISWEWKRKPLQGYSYTIGLSYRRKVLSDIKSVLAEVGGDKLLQQFVDGCFGHLLRFVGGISCSKALHELISHEIFLAGARDDELWFRIGKTNIRFAPPEYALVTGLRFGSSSFDPLGTHEMLRDGVFNRFCSGQSINIQELWNMFNQRRLIRPPEDYLKVAHVLALHLMALGNDSPKTIERWVWVLVDDLDAWNRFPWGAYTYQALMHYLNMLPRKRESERLRYQFLGPVWALQIWSYEAIPRLGNKSALANGKVTMPRCLKWSFPSGKKGLPKLFLEQKLDCRVTLEPTDEEKLQPYWLSLQTEQPLGVRYVPPPSRKRRHVVATAADLSPPPPRCSSIHAPPLAESSSAGEPDNPVEVPDTDDSALSAPKPSARPTRRRSRTWASIYSSLSSGCRPRHVCRWPELLDEDRFADLVSSKVVDRMIKPMAVEVTQILIESMVKLLLPHLEQHIGDLFQARKAENPGDCAKADDEKEAEQSIDGASSSMHNSRQTVNEPSPGLPNQPAPEDAFDGEEQCEVPINDPRLDTGLANHGKSSANQEDSTTPNEESRLNQDGPIRAQTDSTEEAGIRPPLPDEAQEPEPMTEKLMPHLEQKGEDLLKAREVGNQLQTENPGCNADCAKADEKNEQSFHGGSSSMHNSRKIVDEPAAEDAFGSEEQCEVLMNDPRSGVVGHGESFANQEDSAIPNEESRLKRDSPIRAQSHFTEKEIRPPRAGEADEPEFLADPSSTKMKKEKSSSTSKRRSQSPSSDEETTDDEGSESSSGNEKRADLCSSKTKKKSSSMNKSNRRPPSQDEETSDEGSESSSGDEKRADPSSNKMKKKIKSSSMSKQRKRSPSSDEEATDDEGSESSSGNERRTDPSPSKTTKKKKKKKKKSSRTSKSKRQSLSSDKETNGDEGSESSSGDERLPDPSSRKKKKKRSSSRSKRTRRSPSLAEESESSTGDERLADPSSSKTKKKRSSSRSKRRRRSPSSAEETSDDEGSKSSSEDERLADPSPSKTKKKKKKKKKKKFSSTSKRRRRSLSRAEETHDDEGSESSSDDERRRRTKRGKRKKRKRSKSSSSESSDSDGHRRRRNKLKHRRASSPEFDARRSRRRDRSRRPRRHRSVSSSH